MPEFAFEDFWLSVQTLPPKLWPKVWRTLAGSKQQKPSVWAWFAEMEDRPHLVKVPNLGSYDSKIPKIERLKFTPICQRENGPWKHNQDLDWPKLKLEMGVVPERITTEFDGKSYCSFCVSVETAEYSDDWLDERLPVELSPTWDSGMAFIDFYEPFESTPDVFDSSATLAENLVSFFGPAGFRIHEQLGKSLFENHGALVLEERLRLEIKAARILRRGWVCVSCEKPFRYLDNVRDFGPGHPWVSTNGVTLPILKRFGLTKFCESCLMGTAGFDYPKPHSDPRALDAIKRFAQSFSFIPSRDWVDVPVSMGIKSRDSYSNELLNERLEILKSMPYPGPLYRKTSGTADLSYRRYEGERFTESDWHLLLAAAGLVGESKKGPYGLIGFAADGHRCKSLLELNFCNLLSRSRISHEYDPPFNDGSRRRADFLVLGFYVEIAGLLGRPSYDAKIAQKIVDALDRKMRLVVLSGKDLAEINARRTVSDEELGEFLKLAFERNERFL